jgi:hypothetical protein
MASLNNNLKVKPFDKNSLNFIIDCSLVIIGLVMIFSGLSIQFRYHMGRGQFEIIPTPEYYLLLDIHKISIVIGVLFVIIHVILHLKWYKTIISKNLYGKNKISVALNVIFLMTAFTGLYSWSITMFSNIIKAEQLILRKHLIEIHDKLGIILTIIIFIHVIKRLRLLFGMGKKYFNKMSISREIL